MIMLVNGALGHMSLAAIQTGLHHAKPKNKSSYFFLSEMFSTGMTLKTILGHHYSYNTTVNNERRLLTVKPVLPFFLHGRRRGKWAIKRRGPRGEEK